MASSSKANSKQTGDAAARQPSVEAESLSRNIVEAELQKADKRAPETSTLHAQPPSKNVVLVRRVKRKNLSPMEQFTGWLVKNQTGTL